MARGVKLSELADAIFNKFLSMERDEKKEYLREHGITLDGSYVGTFNLSTGRVRINELTNPFNGKIIEGKIAGRKHSFRDRERLAVKLKIGRIEGQPRTPDNIFGFEYIGVVVDQQSAPTDNRSKEERLRKNADRYKNLYEKEQSEKNYIREKYSELSKVYKTVSAANRKNEEDNKRLKGIVSNLRSANETIRNEHLAETALKKKLYQDLDRLEKEKVDLVKVNKDNLFKAAMLAKIIIDRKITSLLHVTPLSNLNSILSEGIVPRIGLCESATFIDPERFDRMPECSSLSVGRINFRYFESKIPEWKGKMRFVCLHIDPLILLDEHIKYYCQHNAATASISRQTTMGKLTTAGDFSEMFAEQVSYIKSGSSDPIVIVRPHALESDCPTSDQAEILYKGVITASSIMAVGFSSQTELDEAKDLLHKYKKKGQVDQYLMRIST